MNHQLEIGSVIKLIRIAKAIPAKNVAELVGISPSALSKYENNQRKIKADLLPKFAEALDVDVSIFFSRNIGVLPIKKEETDMYSIV